MTILAACEPDANDLAPTRFATAAARFAAAPWCPSRSVGVPRGTGSFFGDADHQRQGSFGDTDGGERAVAASAVRDDLDHAA